MLAVFEPTRYGRSAAEIYSFGRIKNVVDREELVLRECLKRAE